MPDRAEPDARPSATPSHPFSLPAGLLLEPSCPDSAIAPPPDPALEPEGFLVFADGGVRLHFLDRGGPDRADSDRDGSDRDGSAAGAPAAGASAVGRAGSAVDGVGSAVGGSGSAADPAVLLIPGLLEPASSGAPVARRLAGAQRTVVADLRGHGLSDVPMDGYDPATLAADAVAVAEGSGLLEAAPLEVCPGCGDRLPAIDGARHAYVGASSACWTRFAEWSSMPPQWPSSPLRRLAIDAYMVQHPGVPERRAIQSVGLHLVGLWLGLERDLPPGDLSSTLQRVMQHPPAWRWLDPPEPNGATTIGDVIAARAAAHEAGAVDAFVRGVWGAWSAHHDVVAGWAADAGVG